MTLFDRIQAEISYLNAMQANTMNEIKSIGLDDNFKITISSDILNSGDNNYSSIWN